MRRIKTLLAFALLSTLGASVVFSQESSKAAAPDATKLQVTQCALKVKGMTCSGCAGIVAKGLLKLAGVRAAKVDFKTGQAQVEFDPVKTTPEEIVARFNQANKGFRIEIPKTSRK